MNRRSAEDSKALGAFLSKCRGRLRPSDFGFAGGLRRTPGLRREEVAQLAGVSVSWYTWLEQGRDISLSAPALERISEALRLAKAEREHLFALASRYAPPRASGKEVSHDIIELVERMGPVPAYVRNARLDILAWNAAVCDLFVDYGALAPHERNSLRLTYLYAPYRNLIRDWEIFARGMLGVFCAARAKAADKAPFDELAEELRGLSAEFCEWWSEGEVQRFDEGHKPLRHPTRGLLDVRYMAFAPEAQPELSFVTYLVRPADGDETS